MKLMIAALTLSMFTATNVLAGAANADLKCTSKDGLSLKGTVPGDFTEFDVTIEAGGKKARLFSTVNQDSFQTEENATLTVVQDLSQGVWTLSSQRKGDEGGFLQAYALPKTVVFKRTANGYSATFNAKASVYLSEISDEQLEKSLSCTLKYEI